jgi:hypothetical protein
MAIKYDDGVSDEYSDSSSDDERSDNATATTVIRDMLRLFKMKSIRPSIDMLSKESRRWIKDLKKQDHIRKKALKIANRKKKS